MNIQFHGLPSVQVATIRHTQRDAYDQPVEIHISEGDAYPCRHCMGEIPKGRPYLILAHRPFSDRNPFAETGPIFLCATDCAPYRCTGQVPAHLRNPTYILRGYTPDQRIVYGTGGVVPRHKILTRVQSLLSRTDIAFVDMRSAENNCYQCRIGRA